MSSIERRVTLAIALVVFGWAHAAVADERETPQELVLRSLGHIARGEINALLPLFARGSLKEGGSVAAFSAFTEVLANTDPDEPRLVARSSEFSTEGVLVETIVYHLAGTDAALLAIGQVQVTETRTELVGLRFDTIPLDPAALFPFVLTDLSYVHYYVLIALFCIPALMLYATIRCLRRESGVGLAWIPFILIGVGQANAIWIPGPLDEALFSFFPARIGLGIEITKLNSFNPWVVSIAMPLGAIVYLWWSGRQPKTQIEPNPEGSLDGQSG